MLSWLANSLLFNVASSQTESEVQCRCATEEGERTDWTERVWGVGSRPFRGRFYLILMRRKFRLLDTLLRASTMEGWTAKLRIDSRRLRRAIVGAQTRVSALQASVNRGV